MALINTLDFLRQMLYAGMSILSLVHNSLKRKRLLWGIIAVLGSIIQVTSGKDKPDLLTRVYLLPPQVFLAVDESSPDGTRKPEKGVKLISKDEVNGDSYDVSQYIQDQGVLPVKGSEASYFLVGNFLLVRNTKENIEMIDMLFFYTSSGVRLSQLSTEFIVGTFTLASDQEIHQPIPYSKFMSRVGKTWKVENELAIVSKSGLRAQGSNNLSWTESNPKDPASEKLTPLSKLSAEVEPELGPDGNTIDTTFTFNFHGRLGSLAEISDIALLSQTVLWNGYSNVIYLSKVDSGNHTAEKNNRDRYVAVIIKSIISNPGGWETKTN